MYIDSIREDVKQISKVVEKVENLETRRVLKEYIITLEKTIKRFEYEIECTKKHLEYLA